MEPGVFVCYSRQDLEFAEELRRRLTVANLDVRIDHGFLVGGDRWQARIDDAIRSADVVLLILSPASATSQYVQYEWAFAAGAGVPIVPVRFAATEPHPHLRQLQWVDFTDGREPWEDLIRAIEQRIATNESSQRRRETDARFTQAEAAVTGDDPDAAREASEWLRGQEGDRANQLLMRGLDRWALWTLVTAVGERGLVEAVPRLVEICWWMHLDQPTRRAAAGSLVAIRSPSIVETIEPRLRRDYENGDGHELSVGVLGQMPSETRIVDLLMDYVRRIRRLPAIPDPSSSSMPDTGLRAAAEALGRQGDPRCLPLLLELLEHTDWTVACTAISALGTFAAVDAAADALLEKASGSDSQRAKAAMEVLAKVRPARVLRGLANLASDCQLDSVVARVTVKFLAASILTTAEPQMLGIVLEHPDREGRAAAAAAIRDHQGPKTLVPNLLPLLEDDATVHLPSPHGTAVRPTPLCDVAAIALVAIGTPEALAALEGRASD